MLATAVLLGGWGLGGSYYVDVPPFPSPLDNMGISVSAALSGLFKNGYDPIVIAVKTSGSSGACPPGTTPVSPSGLSLSDPNAPSKGSVTVSASNNSVTVCQPQATGTPVDSYLSELAQWAVMVAGNVLGQFTGDSLASFLTDPNKTTLTLSELLGGLCKAWGGKKDRWLKAALVKLGEGEKNRLGSTICNLDATYRSILDVLRKAYLYGDEALDGLFKGLSKVIAQGLSPWVAELKAEAIRAYNALPFSEPLEKATATMKEKVQEVASAVIDQIYQNRRARTNPYVDSTLAWLVSQGAQIREEIASSASGGGITTASTPGTPGGTGDYKLPPEELALLMTASSPQVLAAIQNIGEEQEKLRAKVSLVPAQLEELSAQLTKEGGLLEDRFKKADAPAADGDVGYVYAEQAKAKTDTREILISLIEANASVGKQQIVQGKRLEVLLTYLAEQSLQARTLLLKEATKEIEAQIQALEEAKQELLDEANRYASEISQAAAVMDGVVNVIGSLGVERAGMVLSEEEMDALTTGGQAIPAP